MKGLFLNELSARTMARMEKIREDLETEEATKEYTLLQGELIGLKELSEHVEKFDKTFVNDDCNKPIILQDEDSQIIMGLFEDKEDYQKEDPAGIEDFVSASTEAMKNYLLYSATKPRDLNLTHGEYRGIRIYSNFCRDISSEKQVRVARAKREEEDNPLFFEEVEQEITQKIEDGPDLPDMNDKEDDIQVVETEEIDTDYEVSDEETLLTNEEEADIPE